MKRVLAIAGLVLLLAAVAVAAAGWVFSSRVIVPAPYSLMPEFDVLSSDHGPPASVTLPRSDGGRQHAKVDVSGTYGLLWDAGHGLLGPVTAEAGGAVTRGLEPVVGGVPPAGAPARIDPFVYRRDPEADLGLPFEEVPLEGPEGPIRAWFVAAPQGASGRTAVLMVHGRRRGELIETLRFIPAFRSAGLAVLAQSYRNHDTSAQSADGLYHYGASEWQDAIAGARDLAARGVDRVVLFGISMGGAVVLEALERWEPGLPDVIGVALDSPLVDPRAVVELGARKEGLPFPRLLTDLALLVAGLRTGVDFSSLDQATDAASVPVPVMVVAGTADSTVPIAAVDRFVDALRVPVTYHRLEGVEHVEAWNAHGPERYAQWVEAFVAGLEVRAQASLP